MSGSRCIPGRRNERPRCFSPSPALDAYRFLAERNIAAPADTFYAYEPARALGVDAGLRIGLAPYNDDAEVDRLLQALADFLG